MWVALISEHCSTFFTFYLLGQDSKFTIQNFNLSTSFKKGVWNFGVNECV